MNISHLWTYLLDIIFPRPPHIRALEKLTPESFLTKVERSTEPPEPYIESVCAYRDPLVRQCVWHIKYHGNKRLIKLVSLCMHDRLVEYMSDETLFSNARPPLLVPIPLSRERKRERGFNQSLLLAHFVHKQDPTFYKGVRDALKHTRSGVSQTSLRIKSKRLENMRGRFYAPRPEYIKGENVIIVDDVTTTGATIKEARRALKKAGAKRVYAITIAH